MNLQSALINQTKHDKLKNFSNFFSIIIILTFFLNSFVFGAATYTKGSNITGDLATKLAAQIQGPGLTITNPVLKVGSKDQTAIFSNGVAGANLYIDTGILLTCMDADNAFSSNSSGSTSINNSDSGGPDADLLAIDSKAKYDTVVFEFDVTLDKNTRLLLVNYQFASEEYNEYVGSQFNDAFGFFISGGDLNKTYNIARVHNPNEFVTIDTLSQFKPVTVNNVNNGSVGIYDDVTPEDLTNSAYFIDNEGSTDIGVEFDGLTVGLNATLDNLTPGVTYHFKMALADTGDSYWDTGVFVNSINGIRTPEICYDYSYKQNDRFFTEEYNASKGPKLSGDVVVDAPIEITLAIQSMEEADVAAHDVTANVLDINTTQITYHSNSVYVADPGAISRHFIADNTQGMTNTDSSISDIPIDDFQSYEYFYIYYSVDPKTETLDTPLDWNLSYTMTLVLSPTQSVDLNVTAVIDKDTPLCTTSSFVYKPKWGIYNVEDHAISGTGKYNLYTQIVDRPFSIDVVSYDPANLDTPQATTSFVAVDMIDMGGFQDPNTSCSDPQAAITPRVWVAFNNSSVTSVNITQAINDGFLSNSSDFYGKARENTGLRVSYLLDENGSAPIAFTDLGGGNFKMDGFANLAGRSCGIDPRTGNPKLVKNPNGTTYTDKANVACGNAGSSGVKEAVLRQCLECLYSSDVLYLCSRDNFSIRPEAFKIKIYDNNESVGNNKVELPIEVDISAGYNYRYDVIATTHSGDINSSGYTQSFKSHSDKKSLTYKWSPLSTQVTSGCNDIDDKYPSVYLVNGSAADYKNKNDNVGRYELKMIDKIWTKADQSPTHHLLDPSHFNLNDCLQDSNIVPSTTITLNNTNVGCDISSKHTNIDTNTKYVDYNVTVHPYDFNISTISLTKDINNTLIKNSDFVYMNNIFQDANMSVRYIGSIRAIGKDNKNLSNFVRNCYAKNINLDVTTSDLANNLTNEKTPDFKYRLLERNASNQVFSDSNGTNIAGAITPVDVTIPADHFTKDLSGSSIIEYNLNYDRNLSRAINPIVVTYNNLNVSCLTDSQCQSYTNLKTNYLPSGNLDNNYTNKTVTHIYGRLHTPRQRVADTVTATIPLFYEFYCDSSVNSIPYPCAIGNFNTTISPNALLGKDSVRWYIQTKHIAAIDGNATSTQTRNGNKNSSFSQMAIEPDGIHATYTYNGNDGFPFKTTMELSTQNWLIYNRFNINATKNFFELEFNRAGGDWSGVDKSKINIDSNASSNTNRRIQW